MHNCPDCGCETKHKWLNKFDGTSLEVGMCPECFRITVEGDEPIAVDETEGLDDYSNQWDYE